MLCGMYSLSFPLSLSCYCQGEEWYHCNRSMLSHIHPLSTRWGLRCPRQVNSTLHYIFMTPVDNEPLSGQWEGCVNEMKTVTFDIWCNINQCCFLKAPLANIFNINDDLKNSDAHLWCLTSFSSLFGFYGTLLLMTTLWIIAVWWTYDPLPLLVFPKCCLSTHMNIMLLSNVISVDWAWDIFSSLLRGKKRENGRN